MDAVSACQTSSGPDAWMRPPDTFVGNFRICLLGAVFRAWVASPLTRTMDS